MRNTNIIVWLNTIGNPLSAGLLAIFIALNLFKNITLQLKIPFNIIVFIIYIKMLTIGFKLVNLEKDH